VARLLLGVAIGVAVGLVAGAALGIEAQSEETVALAAEAGIDDPNELQAAADSVGVTPVVYVRTTPPHAPPLLVAVVWSRLAACESSGNWAAVSRSGVYRGGLQFDQPTWRAYGGLAYASSAHLAAPAQQIAIAERLRAARGFQPWPVCSRRLGLR
jgi:hypothetical protein